MPKIQKHSSVREGLLRKARATRGLTWRKGFIRKTARGLARGHLEN